MCSDEVRDSFARRGGVRRGIKKEPRGAGGPVWWRRGVGGREQPPVGFFPWARTTESKRGEQVGRKPRVVNARSGQRLEDSFKPVKELAVGRRESPALSELL